MCTSLVIWYIVDGHPAGVIVFLFIFVFFEFYFLMKYPRFVVVALISVITQGKFRFIFAGHVANGSRVLIVGYSLEVKKVGQAVSVFPIWTRLGPYNVRWPQAMDNPTIPPTYSRLIDWLASPEACW